MKMPLILYAKEYNEFQKQRYYISKQWFLFETDKWLIVKT